MTITLNVYVEYQVLPQASVWYLISGVGALSGVWYCIVIRHDLFIFDPPVAVEVIKLFLYLAAQASPVVTVQPIPHHTQAILPLVLIKGKVLYPGCDAATAPKRRAY